DEAGIEGVHRRILDRQPRTRGRRKVLGVDRVLGDINSLLEARHVAFERRVVKHAAVDSNVLPGPAVRLERIAAHLMDPAVANEQPLRIERRYAVRILNPQGWVPPETVVDVTCVDFAVGSVEV